jgi:hypothetical protein
MKTLVTGANGHLGFNLGLRDAPQIIRFSDRLVETYILRDVPELL